MVKTYENFDSVKDLGDYENIIFVRNKFTNFNIICKINITVTQSLYEIPKL